MTNHSQHMNFEFDHGSILGVILSWIITAFGLLTLNEYAVLVGMGVGATAIGVNIMKIMNQRKEAKLLDEKIREMEEDDEPET